MIILTKPALLTYKKSVYFKLCIGVYVLMKSWCKAPEDGDDAETCRR
jgi:hypothetical protein